MSYSGEEKVKDYKRIIKRNRAKRRVYLLCLLIVGIICFLFFAPQFKIANIIVTNNDRVLTQDIIDASGIGYGNNLFRYGAKSVAESITKIPNIKDVKVRRGFPNTVSITVTERKPFAYIKTYEGYLYVDDEGMVLELNDMPPENVFLELQGIPQEESVVGEKIFKNNSTFLQKYLATIEKILDNGMTEKVNLINLYNGEKIALRYNKLDVILGDEEQLEYKFSQMKSIISEIGENARGTLDLTTPARAYHAP